MPKTVWMLNHYAQPPGGNNGHTRHYSLAMHLPAHGWDSVVIAAAHDLPRPTTDETIDSVRFLWVRTPRYVGNGLRRIWNMVVYALALMIPSNTAHLPKPDVVIGSSAPPFAAFAGYLLARRHKAAFIYEVRDLWPQSLIDLNQASPYHPLMLLFAWMERFLSRRADAIIGLPPLLDRYFVPRGIAADRIHWLPNGVDLSLFPAPMEKSPSSPFTFMYFGAHGHGNALHHLIDAMAILQRENTPAQLRLIGHGPLKIRLQEQAKNLALTHVTFEDSVPKHALASVAAHADAFAFNVMDAPVLTRYGISPNKLFDFFACGRPVLFACSAANNPVADAAAGITVAAGDAAAIARGMQQMMAVPHSERAAMGQNARRHVQEHYAFAVLAQRCATVLEHAHANRR